GLLRGSERLPAQRRTMPVPRPDSTPTACRTCGGGSDVAASFRWPEGGVFPCRVAKPVDSLELTELMRDCLRDLTDEEPHEYVPGKFWIEHQGLGFAVMADERHFPAIRLHHPALDDVPLGKRQEVIDFANSLHGRSSTTGSF